MCHNAASAIDQLPAWFNRGLAFAILTVLASYIVWVWRRPRVIGRQGWVVTLPGGPLTLLQIGIGIVDLACCALAMFMLLPLEPNIGFVTLAVIFVAATLLGFASHAPGGIGVFDAAMLVALWQFDKQKLLAGLLLFRLLYYVVPFVLSVLILGGRELLLGLPRRSGRRHCRPPPRGRIAPGVRTLGPAKTGRRCGNDCRSRYETAMNRRTLSPSGARESHEASAATISGAANRMTAIHDGGRGARLGPWWDRLKRGRFVLIVTALVFAVLWEGGMLATQAALASFAIIAVAVLIRAASGEIARQTLPHADSPALRVGDPLVEAVLAGLPDPVVALDRHGDVVALNARASAMAPALRRGEPVSLALRVPEVLDSIRRAVATGNSQRVEFFERVPVDRWYEAIVTPMALAGTALARSRARGLPRSHALAAGRGDARRLHRQCESRAAHAARRTVRLHRDLAGARRVTTRRRACASCPSCRRRRPAWRG